MNLMSVCYSWEQAQRKLTLKRYRFLFSVNGLGWAFTSNDYSAKVLLKLYLKAAQLLFKGLAQRK